MPPLGQLNCSVYWCGTNLRLPELETTYRDKLADTHVAVPRFPSRFEIRLKSSGVIHWGLAMFVYIDGRLHCTRVSYNLENVELQCDQREVSLADGRFFRAPWYFREIWPPTSRPPPNAVEPTFGGACVGIIEVVVLRLCRQDDLNVPRGLSQTSPTAQMARAWHSMYPQRHIIIRGTGLDGNDSDSDKNGATDTTDANGTGSSNKRKKTSPGHKKHGNDTVRTNAAASSSTAATISPATVSAPPQTVNHYYTFYFGPNGAYHTVPGAWPLSAPSGGHVAPPPSVSSDQSSSGEEGVEEESKVDDKGETTETSGLVSSEKKADENGAATLFQTTAAAENKTWTIQAVTTEVGNGTNGSKNGEPSKNNDGNSGGDNANASQLFGNEPAGEDTTSVWAGGKDENKDPNKGKASGENKNGEASKPVDGSGGFLSWGGADSKDSQEKGNSVEKQSSNDKQDDSSWGNGDAEAKPSEGWSGADVSTDVNANADAAQPSGWGGTDTSTDANTTADVNQLSGWGGADTDANASNDADANQSSGWGDVDTTNEDASKSSDKTDEQDRNADKSNDGGWGGNSGNLFEAANDDASKPADPANGEFTWGGADDANAADDDKEDEQPKIEKPSWSTPEKEAGVTSSSTQTRESDNSTQQVGNEASVLAPVNDENQPPAGAGIDQNTSAAISSGKSNTITDAGQNKTAPAGAKDQTGDANITSAVPTEATATTASVEPDPVAAASASAPDQVGAPTTTTAQVAVPSTTATPSTPAATPGPAPEHAPAPAVVRTVGAVPSDFDAAQASTSAAVPAPAPAAARPFVPALTANQAGSPPRSYWQAWHDAAMRGEPAPHEYFDPNVREGPYVLQQDVVTQHGITHQVHMQEFIYDEQCPQQPLQDLRYLDSHDDPFATFVFRYRDENELLQKTGIDAREPRWMAARRMMAMDKQDMVECLVGYDNVKVAGFVRPGVAAGTMPCYTDHRGLRSGPSTAGNSNVGVSSAGGASAGGASSGNIGAPGHSSQPSRTEQIRESAAHESSNAANGRDSTEHKLDGFDAEKEAPVEQEASDTKNPVKQETPASLTNADTSSPYSSSSTSSSAGSTSTATPSGSVPSTFPKFIDEKGVEIPTGNLMPLHHLTGLQLDGVKNPPGQGPYHFAFVSDEPPGGTQSHPWDRETDVLCGLRQGTQQGSAYDTVYYIHLGMRVDKLLNKLRSTQHGTQDAMQQTTQEHTHHNTLPNTHNKTSRSTLHDTSQSTQQNTPQGILHNSQQGTQQSTQQHRSRGIALGMPQGIGPMSKPPRSPEKKKVHFKLDEDEEDGEHA